MKYVIVEGCGERYTLEIGDGALLRLMHEDTRPGAREVPQEHDSETSEAWLNVPAWLLVFLAKGDFVTVRSDE